MIGLLDLSPVVRDGDGSLDPNAGPKLQFWLLVASGSGRKEVFVIDAFIVKSQKSLETWTFALSPRNFRAKEQWTAQHY